MGCVKPDYKCIMLYSWCRDLTRIGGRIKGDNKNVTKYIKAYYANEAEYLFYINTVHPIIWGDEKSNQYYDVYSTLESSTCNKVD